MDKNIRETLLKEALQNRKITEVEIVEDNGKQLGAIKLDTGVKFYIDTNEIQWLIS